MTFTLLETITLPEVNGIGYLYEHQKTKSQVIFVVNDDTNKSFSISFATPPYSDNGIAHILEHSVLCGSKKYPTKEPFVELEKGSLNTFLNAMTFADKTMYPVASQNDKDFYNLIDVYLDAVFFPNLRQDPRILAQEGWHYHLEQLEDDLTYKGVVYNEMKGVYASSQEVIDTAIQTALYPDTIYRYDSGGNPKDIPTLTQDEFIQFHETYYHPSNAYTFIYGNVNVDEQLQHLATYFNQFNYQAIDKKLHKQPAFEQMKTLQLPYSIAENESLQQKTVIGLDFVVGESKNVALNTYFAILSEILIGSNASPIWKNVMKASIGHHVTGSYDHYTLQSSFGIQLKNSEAEHAERFKQIVFDTLHELVENGIPDKLIQGAINRIKFLLKEASFADYPKGVFYAISATSLAIYGQSPFDALQIDQHIRFIEENPNYLRTLIQECLLDNAHVLLTIATPEHCLMEKETQLVHEQLQQKKEHLTSCELQILLEQTKALISKQSEPDSPEALNTIPLLSLTDLNKTAVDIPLNIEKQGTITSLHHPAFTGGIHYISFVFNLEHLTLEELRYATLATRLFGNLSTTEHTLDDLTTDIDIYTGGLMFQTTVHKKDKANDLFNPELIVKGKVFSQNVPEMLTLIHEILTKTIFNQPHKLREQCLKLKVEMETQYQRQGHLVAYSQLLASYSKADKLEEEMTGVSFYRFICQLMKHFDKQVDNIIRALSSVVLKLYTQHNLLVQYIADNSDYPTHKQAVQQFIAQFNNSPLEKVAWKLELEHQTTGLSIDSEVNYVAQGYNTHLLNLEYDARLLVLKNVLSYNYLWNKVRVQGGAYGAFPIISRNGDIVFVSYRDPNIAQTIEVYEQAGEFIKTLDLDERELTKIILGTFGNLDIPLSPRKAGEIAFLRYRLGISFDTVQKERLDMLHTSLTDLHDLAEHIQQAMKQQYRCVVGNQNQLKQSKNYIETLAPLLN